MPSRRQFIRSSFALGAVGLASPSLILADPYRPLIHRPLSGTPVRVRGRVLSGGQGVSGVAVSDGFDVVATGSDGAFSLITSDRQSFVFASIPSGHNIPTLSSGPASFFRRIEPNALNEMEAVFEFEPGPDDSRHAVLALGDTQTQTQWEMDRLHAESVPDMIETVSGMGETPVFGVACGDIMFDDLTLYPEYERAVRRIGVPFFQVVGNHDLDRSSPSDEGSTRTFESRFGPRYYSFNRGEVHYVVLDDVLWHSSGYIGHLGTEQLAWLERDLQLLERGSTVVVLTHIPVYCTQHTRRGERSPSNSVVLTNREYLYRLLEPFESHILSGHTHENEHVLNGGTHEHVLGTTCGAWWSDDICHDGTPNGYALYEADGSDISWRYKSTGQSFNHQLRVYPAGSDPRAKGEIMANVWDWDPAWSVVWYQGGTRRGVMSRRVGRDPLAVERFLGPDLPEHRPWVDPMMIDHLFYAPYEPGAGQIVVEATDRFGRVYAERLAG